MPCWMARSFASTTAGAAHLMTSYSTAANHGFTPSTCSWCDGKDLRFNGLLERKRKLRSIIPANDRLLY